jgi:hypothetical protein
MNWAADRRQRLLPRPTAPGTTFTLRAVAAVLLGAVAVLLRSLIRHGTHCCPHAAFRLGRGC